MVRSRSCREPSGAHQTARSRASGADTGFLQLLEAAGRSPARNGLEEPAARRPLEMNMRASDRKEKKSGVLSRMFVHEVDIDNIETKPPLKDNL
jgi:hypothetical protein